MRHDENGRFHPPTHPVTLGHVSLDHPPTPLGVTYLLLMIWVWMTCADIRVCIVMVLNLHSATTICKSSTNATPFKINLMNSNSEHCCHNAQRHKSVDISNKTILQNSYNGFIWKLDFKDLRSTFVPCYFLTDLG